MNKITPDVVASVISAAGDEVTGISRLRNIIIMLNMVGYLEGLGFPQGYFGPVGKEVDFAISDAVALGLVRETREKSICGGFYSIYSQGDMNDDGRLAVAKHLIDSMRNSKSVSLELVVMAIMLRQSDVPDVWEEVRRRKPSKASAKHLDEAKQLLSELSKIDTPNALPEILDHHLYLA